MSIIHCKKIRRFDLPTLGHFHGTLARTTRSSGGIVEKERRTACRIGSGAAAGQCKEIRHSLDWRVPGLP